MADTGPAKLPGLQVPKLADPALAKWVQAVSERMEVREGARGNPAEAVVLQRDLAGLTKASNYLLAPKRDPAPGDVVIDLGGGLSASVAVDAFAESIRNSKLYKYLMTRLDDPHRFDDLPAEVRAVLLRDLAQEAAKLGADITRVETKFQSSISSLAMVIDQLTASVGDASAGVREVTFATAAENHAQAGKITQVVASLGNYFQDGAPGRVTIESEMIATADRVDGLEGHYFLKINAGRAVAGFGILASDTQAGTDSAFIVQVDRFAIVLPGDVNALTNSPDLAKVPFGMDANGIYMNSNVYLKGTMKIDGLTGVSLNAALQNKPTNIGINGTVWNPAGATAAILATRTPDKQQLVMGDSVTLLGTGATYYWSGSEWAQVSFILNGNMLINGSVSASKIDTRGLTIKDNLGNVILGSGTGLDWSWLTGTGKTAVETNLTLALGNASAAQGVADAARDGLVAIANDNILSPSEKPAVKLDYDVLIGEQAGIDAQAVAYGISTEKTNYDNTIVTLTAYLGALSGWDTIPGSDVPINGLSFRAYFASVYVNRQTLLNKIAAVAGTRATAAGVTGLGALATANDVYIGDRVRFTNGDVLRPQDFVHSLNHITEGNISNFMGNAAIGHAYIGSLAVDTINLAGNAVTVPASGSSGVGGYPSCSLWMPQAGTVYVTGNLWMYETTTSSGGGLVLAAYSAQLNCSNGGAGGYCITHSAYARHTTVATAMRFDVGAGWNTFSMSATALDGAYQPQGGTIMAIGTMK